MAYCQILFTATGYYTWIVPADWNTQCHTIEAVGGGGASTDTMYSGGGGGYAKVTCLPHMIPGQKVYICVGSGGCAAYAANWFCCTGGNTPCADVRTNGATSWLSTKYQDPLCWSTQMYNYCSTCGIRAMGGLAGGSGNNAFGCTTSYFAQYGGGGGNYTYGMNASCTVNVGQVTYPGGPGASTAGFGFIPPLGGFGGGGAAGPFGPGVGGKSFACGSGVACTQFGSGWPGGGSSGGSSERPGIEYVCSM
jgi:hypothetical protein